MSTLNDVIFKALEANGDVMTTDELADAVTAAVEQALSVRPSIAPPQEDPMLKLIRDQNDILRNIYTVLRARR